MTVKNILSILKFFKKFENLMRLVDWCILHAKKKRKILATMVKF